MVCEDADVVPENPLNTVAPAAAAGQKLRTPVQTLCDAAALDKIDQSQDNIETGEMATFRQTPREQR